MQKKRKPPEETTTISVINRANHKAYPENVYCANNIGVSFHCKRERCTEDQLLNRGFCKKACARSSTLSSCTTRPVSFFDDKGSKSESEAPSVKDTKVLASQNIAKIVEQIWNIPQRVRKGYNETRVNWKERPFGTLENSPWRLIAPTRFVI